MKGGYLTVAVLGVRFSKLLKSKLEKLLESANQNMPLETSLEVKQSPSNLLQSPKIASAADSESVISTPSLTLSSTLSSKQDFQDGQDSRKAIQMLSDISGAPADAITNKKTLQEIGVDSLAAVELKGDLEKRLML